MQKIDALKYFDDIIFARKRTFKLQNKAKAHTSDSPKIFSLIVRFKCEKVRNEVMRLKKVYGDIPVSEIFPDIPNVANNRILINEWLQPHIFKLLQLTRSKAKNLGYERVWTINEVISVQKNASSPKIEIFSESDLDKLI